MLRLQSTRSQDGFTLIELLVTIGVFALLAGAILGVTSAITRTTKIAREKMVLSSLASEYLEVVRNMPYSQVGTIAGNPTGQLPDCPMSQQPGCPKAFSRTIEGTVYKVFYEVTYVDDPADYLATTPSPNTDTSAADYKQVKMDILNVTTGVITNFVTTIVPQGLEGANNSGALSIKVVDAQGQPVQNANIHIQSPTSSPTLILDRASDANGNWIEVGLPAKVNNYRIVVSKGGYSTDQTYPITAQNPNPTKPDATIQVGKVTQITFAIDLLSNLTIRTYNKFCQATDNVKVNVVGAKLIGTSPNVPKFAQMYTSGTSGFPSGQIVLNNIEWDTYTPTLVPNQGWMVIGTSPIQKIDVLPNTSQTFTMYLDTGTSSNSLLLTVKDSTTQAPLEGVAVHFQKGGSTPQDYYGTTGGSVWVQKTWAGGSGYATWDVTNADKYFQAVGSIYVNTSNGSNDVELAKAGNNYQVNATSTLESSTFDGGASTTNFTTISWNPTSQNASTFLGIQLASNNDNTTWNYVGPDGTSKTYYIVPGTNISNVHDNDRYLRYKVYLKTSDNKSTPVLSSIMMNYVSGCFAPGQSFFNNLTPSNGNAYTIWLTLPGYQDLIINGVDIGSNNPPLEVLMTPL